MTIVEILVVVAIFVMLASMGVVQLLRAQLVTREQFALSNLRVVAKACQYFFLNTQRYPNNLTELGPGSANPPYLDATVAQDPATKQGYTFTYTGQSSTGLPPYTGFDLHVRPEVYRQTGERSFYTTQAMIVHATTEDLAATSSDPEVP